MGLSGSGGGSGAAGAGGPGSGSADTIARGPSLSGYASTNTSGGGVSSGVGVGVSTTLISTVTGRAGSGGGVAERTGPCSPPPQADKSTTATAATMGAIVSRICNRLGRRGGRRFRWLRFSRWTAPIIHRSAQGERCRCGAGGPPGLRGAARWLSRSETRGKDIPRNRPPCPLRKVTHWRAGSDC